MTAARSRRFITLRLVAAVLLLLASSHVRVLQAHADSASVSATSGTVMVQAAGSDSQNQLYSDAQSVAPGDVVQVNEDGEAALTNGDALTVRIFHRSQARVLGDSAVSVYELLQGATYNTATPGADTGAGVVVSTPGATIASTSGTFLLDYDPNSQTTWVVVTDGTATVTGAGRAVDIPAAFLTSLVNGAAPSTPQAASRATVGSTLPAVDDLTNGAFTDADILAAPPPVSADTQAQPAASAADSGILPSLSDLGGLVPFPSTATLRAGRTTVWYWPQRQGDLDTVNQDDTRSVSAGDGVNVSNDGRAVLSFPDLDVQIFRHSQLQMIPTIDPNGYGLGYDLVQGATLNTVSASAVQQLSNNRIGVRAGWAVVTAVYTAHPTADDDLRIAQTSAQGDTQFLVVYDGTKTWVVVTQGSVLVEPVVATPGAIPTGAPAAAPVVVSAGFQTWVEPAQPPVPPRPASRAEIGDQFQVIDDLTAGELTDAQVLAGSAVKPVDVSAASAKPPAVSVGAASRCYQFTSVFGVPYVFQVRYPFLPNPRIRYLNAPVNTQFTAAYDQITFANISDDSLLPTVTLTVNGVRVYSYSGMDARILSFAWGNGIAAVGVPSASVVDIVYQRRDSNTGEVTTTGVRLTGQLGTFPTPSLPETLPPPTAYVRTLFQYMKGSDRPVFSSVSSISNC